MEDYCTKNCSSQLGSVAMIVSDCFDLKVRTNVAKFTNARITKYFDSA